MAVYLEFYGQRDEALKMNSFLQGKETKEDTPDEVRLEAFPNGSPLPVLIKNFATSGLTEE